MKRERRKPTVRSIACTDHDWRPAYAKPKKDASLLAEYGRGELEDYQRCEKCQRLSQRRYDRISSAGKHYVDPRVYSLDESLEMMKQVHTWNDRVAKTEEGRRINLAFGKIVLDFASADDAEFSGDPAIETDPDRKAWEKPYRRIAVPLQVTHAMKERVYDIARSAYRQLDEDKP